MELPIHLSKTSREPIYHQIENQMKTLIASGQLTKGLPLPSIRSLAKDLETSVITIRRAYQNLEYQGFIQTTQGKGTFVADIDHDMKQQMKVDEVYQAIEAAVEIAFKYDYTAEQLKKMCLEIIHKKGGNQT
ncbi:MULTISPECIES: GntR family transcriptional regulator [Virgibacillus]|uniref:GntR family transcriptional regulator n=1 Tax=Virgibacillus dokdonensis TaxID=302167 RepID=A0A2K9IYX1_9BACI|nr:MULTISPECIES: GntR family transcriptional regulator [Virgibacillus]AUJ24887.1 HTH-type transcriptional repressor YvoA [Virgibacillus dokdonensis]NWO13790.1 GntR family transcriptional regulator [Virgibacillus sp.]